MALSQTEQNLVVLGVAIVFIVVLYLLHRYYERAEQHARHTNELLPDGSLSLTEMSELPMFTFEAPAATPSLSLTEISELPMFTYEAPAATPSPQDSDGEGRECAVCLHELDHGDVVRLLPACMHFFHASCIERWLSVKASCPVCRTFPEPVHGEAALSPPLPQLRRYEQPTAIRIFMDMLVESLLRIMSRSHRPEYVATAAGEV